jgi:hypothetical protein
LDIRFQARDEAGYITHGQSASIMTTSLLSQTAPEFDRGHPHPQHSSITTTAGAMGKVSRKIMMNDCGDYHCQSLLISVFNLKDHRSDTILVNCIKEIQRMHQEVKACA